jgi:transposase
VLELIDEAFSQYRRFLETADIFDYQVWSTGFKVRVQQAVQQFLPLAGYLAGKILRSLRDKQQQPIPGTFSDAVFT